MNIGKKEKLVNEYDKLKKTWGHAFSAIYYFQDELHFEGSDVGRVYCIRRTCC